MFRRKALQRAEARLVTTWQARGLRPVRELSPRHRDVVDSNLKRANQWVGENPIEPLGDGWTRRAGRTFYPYTRVLSYAPHMKRNRGHWVYSELQLEHDDENLYGIFRAELPVGLTSRLEVARVEELGRDLVAAAARMDELAARHMEHFLASVEGQGARYSKYPFDSTLSSTTVREFETAPFSSRLETIQLTVAEGLQEAADRRELEAARAAKLAEGLELLHSKGFA